MAIRYRTEFEQITKTTKVQSNCNSITFVVMAGSPDALINNFPVTNATPLVIEGNAGEINVTEYNVSFGTSLEGNVWVLRYINI